MHKKSLNLLTYDFNSHRILSKHFITAKNLSGRFITWGHGGT